MKFTHTNIVAKDWKTLADFYIKIFNCTVKPPERDLSGDWLDQATGLTQAKLKGVHLLLPGHGTEAPTLEIFTYEEIDEHEPVFANSRGFSHIAFEVDDVETTLSAALNMGASNLGKITRKLIEGLGTLVFVYFRDPEGNIIEIQSWER
ncbi:VOC family protein [bacterium]|nr:VOC family protein [bacterium]